MAHADTDRADLRKSTAPDGRMTFWGALLQNGAYQAVANTLFKSQRRQFWILASLPLFWIFFANLGPIVEMFWIGFLDSYPPKVGHEPQFTLANWAAFFQDRVFIIPFFRTLAFSFIFTAITLLITYPVERRRLDVFTRFLLPAKVEPAAVRHTELTLMMMQLVASGRGVCALPDWALAEYLERDYVEARKLGREGLHGELFAAIREEEYEQAWMKDFLEIARQFLLQGRD